MAGNFFGIISNGDELAWALPSPPAARLDPERTDAVYFDDDESCRLWRELPAPAAITGQMGIPRAD